MHVITTDNIHASHATGCFVDIPREPVPEGGVGCIIPAGCTLYIERISRCHSLMNLAMDRECHRSCGRILWVPRRLVQEVSDKVDEEWFKVVFAGAPDFGCLYPGKEENGGGAVLWGHLYVSSGRLMKVPFPLPPGAGGYVAKPSIDADKARELAFFNAVVNGCCPRGKPCRWHQ